MISKFSVKKPYTVLVGVVLAIVLGVVSFTRMTADLLPNINLPYILIMTTYPGASPETVEAVVTQPVEAGMATVSNIENISSVSNENYSMVILEFAQSANMDTASLEIRENLDQIEGYWDDSVGKPIMIKINPDMLPVMIAAVGVEGMDNAQISTYVQDSVVPDIESIEGVASVDTVGLLEESVHVIIRQDKVDAINEKVFAAIDDKMADAKKELDDAQKTIADSKNELDKGKKELVDGQKELDDGKQELEKGKNDLESGKKELESKQNDTANQLAVQKNALLTAKAQLEDMQTRLTTAKSMNDGLQEMNTGIEQLDGMINSLNSLSGSTMAYMTAVSGGDADSINQLKVKVTGNQALAQMIASDATLSNAVSLDALAALDWTDPANMTAVQTVLGTIDYMLPTATAKIEEQKDSLQAQADKMEAALNAQTNGLGYDAYVALINSELAKQNITDIDKSLKDINDGLIAIEKGEMTAAIEFANGKASLSLGEYQINLTESQLESAQAQLDAGWDQIKSGQDQLKDAEEQLKDGLEQFEDAKESAYDQADMNGILTVDTVKGLLTAQNFSMPAGYVTEEGIEYLVRVGDKPSTVEELKALPLMNLHMDGVDVITLGDVADVFYTDNSDEIYTNVNGSPGVMLSIQKQTGYSTGQVSDRLLDRFKELMERDSDLSILTLMDQGIYIDLVMDSIINNILVGAALAIIILILFLKDLRPTIVIAFSIPISLVTAIVCMYFSGVTLNVISLSGLALGIGMLVDNSIVVIENIYRLRGEGYSMRDAAIAGAKEVSGAIMASTLTTICVFLPIVFTEGITRQLFVDMGLTIAYSLIASLVIALTVVPAMSSKMLTKTGEKKQGKILNGIINGYVKVLKASLKVKPIVFVLVIGLLAGSVVAAMSNGTAFMPEMDSTQMTVNVSMDEEATLQELGDMTNQVVEIIMEIPEIEDVGAMANSSSSALMGGAFGGGSGNGTSIYVVTAEERSISNQDIADMILEKTKDLDAEITVETSSMDMSALGGSGISIQVRGRDIDTLQRLAGEVAAIVESVEGTKNVSDGLGETDEELRVIIERDKAIDYGLTVAQVFSQVMAKVADATSATTLVTESKDYSVYVMNGNDIELTRELVKEIEIDGTDADGKAIKVPLSELAHFESAKSLESIHRADQTRYVEVTSEIADGYNIGLVATQVEKRLENFETPDGYRLVFSGENQTINDAMKQVMLMLALALVFMYLIMVAQFQSLLSPFIIMFTIPLAFTGGFMGLFVAGSEVSVIAMIGFVMLSGIIVNNGIVLIDYINQLRESGMESVEAILTAGRTRLRPVLMTALTTILALSTMVFNNDMGSEMAKPMALVTIGGLLYGTLLTLIVIPAIYDSFAKIGEKRTRKHQESDLYED
ncbi:MAG: efflux RND transporter permease subunit [Acetatifactor sp.]|nr:efflux RND transporter permease subunit [Acetatifactor sp.]